MSGRFPWLSLTLLLPFAGALVVAALPARSERAIRGTALAWSLAAFAASLGVLANFVPDSGEMQMVERLSWLPRLGAQYHLGVDGISLFLVLLTTFLFPICLIASWDQSRRVKQFAIVILATEGAVLGVFLALDLLLFYLFWEGVLIPMYLLIGIWGYERRVYATVKFFLFTLLGGLLMLVAVAALHLGVLDATGIRTFDYERLRQAAPALALGTQAWLFAGFAMSFGVKIPLFPVHTWLPDAHTEAPTAGSVILAGVLLKMGAYGFIRFAIPLFPDAAAAAAPVMIVLAVIGILYGAAVSVVQSDLKRLVAYSSVSHMGFIVLGMFAFSIQAAQGATLQMINHGLSTGALFLLVGMLYSRRHSRAIADFGGIGASAPVLSGAFLIAALASLGLPGLNGFAGEFLILAGTFRVNRLAAILGTGGVVLAALYLLWAYQRVFHGPPVREENRVMKDLSGRERLAVYPILALIVLIGVWPQPFLSRMEASVTRAYASVMDRR
ncbi:MAG TPA: NADH-quinone oxidoreductase subunit M [Actinomycetota bacterium]|nr:NADH-quinone oxidoreductase subunit M [Actinomycetota bacterium]